MRFSLMFVHKGLKCPYAVGLVLLCLCHCQKRKKKKGLPSFCGICLILGLRINSCVWIRAYAQQGTKLSGACHLKHINPSKPILNQKHIGIYTYYNMTLGFCGCLFYNSS